MTRKAQLVAVAVTAAAVGIFATNAIWESGDARAGCFAGAAVFLMLLLMMAVFGDEL